jgi:hypothetical protein
MGGLIHTAVGTVGRDTKDTQQFPREMTRQSLIDRLGGFYATCLWKQ